MALLIVTHTTTAHFTLLTLATVIADFIFLRNETLTLVVTYFLKTTAPVLATVGYPVVALSRSVVAAISTTLTPIVQSSPGPGRPGVRIIPAMFVVVLALTVPVPVMPIFPA